MLFNSIEFAVFLPIIFFIYWYVTNRNLKVQNTLLLVASYVFYGWWDWRFLSLIIFSSMVDFAVGLALSNESVKNRRRFLLSISIFVNLGLLGFFKYYNFFIDSFVEAFTFLGTHIEASRLNIVLPVGISFYTFQTLSYSIDVYKRKITPTKNALAFFTFVSFFPQLVAGPIERASNLLPQFYRKRKFDKELAVDGLQQILWGLFKKVVIADNCARYVNEIFDDYDNLNGSTLYLGAVLFAFQIYGDFSGYSDIAIGTSKLFGFKLKNNFAYPYFSRDIGEFWRRWHISLSTWFRDYLYIPLGGSRGNTFQKVRNIFIIFIVSGFWHGANWTFIIWGFLNALYFLPLLLLKQNRINMNTIGEGSIIPNYKEFLQMIFTFFLTTIAWIFFRSANVTQSIDYLSEVFSVSFFNLPNILPLDLLLILGVFIFIEWISRDKSHPLNFSYQADNIWLNLLRFSGVSAIIWSIVFWGAFENKEFIYFQF